MEEADLAFIAVGHGQPLHRYAQDTCGICGETIPCEKQRLVAEVRRLRAAVAELEDRG